ncbi:helix-turn-helix domain-containing protein [Saccharopolyspora sp. TS4A08]|uniref:Helix-turn-helix domain-containing protein n=1 Tax=Saccharopolyspora ipomoeae TaxID=3042027 RepID=A0ABT6PVW9_9PSEU|nr:TetR/AcrR family transcriptional regulator [Saccharopolyspora sp. TS4A08]MDI2032106.1 helix-turn-helix domain-containing protein [Saccharopolyspora sp. TS4A08]
MTQPTDRADRILDAAGELMVRLGSRKVTIDDVARRAEVGKGTVYLHWRTKEQLFEALIMRESIGMLNELTEAMRADPAEARPHRFFRRSFLLTAHDPLMKALVTGDTELLGNLKRFGRSGEAQRFGDRYRELIFKHRLLRDDLPNAYLALTATASGFHFTDAINPDFAALADETKADALAHTIRAAFEPEGEPDPSSLATVASEIGNLFDELNAQFREWIYTPPRSG